LALEPLGRERVLTQTVRRAVRLFLDQLLQLVAVAVQKAMELLVALVALVAEPHKVFWVEMEQLDKEILEVAVVEVDTVVVEVGLGLLVLVQPLVEAVLVLLLVYQGQALSMQVEAPDRVAVAQVELILEMVGKE